MDELTRLRLFVLIADEGSFSSVARLRGLTPSAVSRQMARLEEDLGARLLQRTTRKQVLTEAGRIYLRHARRIVEDLDTARQEMAQLSDAPSGRLRVTAEADLAVRLLSPMMPGFLARYPDLRLQLFVSATLEDLIERDMDVAIRVGHLTSSSLVARQLTMSRSLLVASPDYLARVGTPQQPQDLTELSCLSFRVGPEATVWRFRTASGGVEVPVSGQIQAASLEFLRHSARAGFGVAMLPSWVVRDDLATGALVPLLSHVSLDPPATPISAVFPSGRNLAPKVRAFVDYVSAHAAGMLP